MSRKCEELLRRQLIEEVAAHALDVHRRRGLERREPVVGQDGELTAPIGGTRLAPHPAQLLEARHGVRQAAARRLGRVGQFAHPSRAVGRLREHHEDLVVTPRQARVALQVALDLLPQEAAGEHPAQPDAPLVGVEPPRLAHAADPSGRRATPS